MQGRAESADPGAGAIAGCVERLVPGHAVRSVGSPKLEPAQAACHRPLERTLRPGGEADIAKMRRRNLLRDFSGVSDAELWAAIQEKQAEGETATGSDVDDLKTPEWLVFIDPAHAQRTRDFRLREVRSPRRFAKYFEKVVLAERLREVRALVGFTRIESPGDYENPAEFPEAQRMKIARGKPSWVPANEIRGEGIFFQFSETEIQNWLGRVQRLHLEFFNAHKQWRKDRGLQPARGLLSRVCGTSCCTRSPTP